MTVAELIVRLAKFNSHSEVMFAYDYGDRSHCMVVDNVRTVEESKVVPSSYGPQELRMPFHDEPVRHSGPTYVVLR
jgi:hypothetical protein